MKDSKLKLIIIYKKKKVVYYKWQTKWEKNRQGWRTWLATNVNGPEKNLMKVYLIGCLKIEDH